MVNLALSPRFSQCLVCREIAHPEDVTMRVLDEDGKRIGLKEAVRYVKSIGLAGSPAALTKSVTRHRQHVETWINRGAVAAPTSPSGVSTVPPKTGPARWLDVNQAQMEVGLEATRLAYERLPAMEDQDLVAVMRVGALAVNKRGELESRGRSLDQVDALIMLAAGYGTPQVNEIEGEAREVED
ncbi:MAG TPA: hypothetical protein VM285_09975 [Polyangia bacterium]|nr:hypothetical protein [Polyangia bacterium]